MIDPVDPDDDPESPGEEEEQERVSGSGEVTTSTMVVKSGARPAKVLLQGSSVSSSEDVEKSDENDQGAFQSIQRHNCSSDYLVSCNFAGFLLLQKSLVKF